MTSPTQRTFDFDMATLNLCINRLKPSGLKQLFRGLLFAAAHQPNLVSDIDADGCVIMTAPIETIAAWSGCSDRTIRRNKLAHTDLVTHSAGPNTPSEWFFNLRSVLPEEAIPWYVQLVENAECHPDKMQNVTLTKRQCHPDEMQNVTLTKRPCHPDKMQNVTLTKSNLSSICFQFNKASLAELAEVLKTLKVAAGGDDWQTFQVEDAALNNPEAVAAIAAVIGGNEAETRRVFIAAVVSQSKDRPWNYFRSLLTSGNFLTTNATKQQIRVAETMQQLTNGTDAAAIVPTTAEEAWAKVISAIRRLDYMHQLDELKLELGPEICAAVRAAGGFGKIAQTQAAFQHQNRAAFADVWNAQQTVAVMMRPQ